MPPSSQISKGGFCHGTFRLLLITLDFCVAVRPLQASSLLTQLGLYLPFICYLLFKSNDIQTFYPSRTAIKFSHLAAAADRMLAQKFSLPHSIISSPLNTTLITLSTLAAIQPVDFLIVVNCNYVAAFVKLSRCASGMVRFASSRACGAYHEVNVQAQVVLTWLRLFLLPWSLFFVRPRVCHCYTIQVQEKKSRARWHEWFSLVGTCLLVLSDTFVTRASLVLSHKI